MSIQLDDLVYTYPDYQKPGFQTLISAKKEFIETGSETTEAVPVRGELFKHQRYLLRLMRQYDNQLIIWSTGTGKSCGVISVAEHYKNTINDLEEIRLDMASPYTRAYVLVKGKSLKNEFKNQLLCKCTDGDYINENIINANTERARRTSVSNSIKTFYTIKTYGTFASELIGLNPEQLNRKYGNSIFILDEVHNIKDVTKGKSTHGKIKQTSRGTSKSGRKKRISGADIYKELWNLFHEVKARKVMLLSATPMINDASELGPILNLLLDKHMQLSDTFNYSTTTLKKLEPYLRGLISYVRALDTGAIPEYQGVILDQEYKIEGRDIPLRSQLVVYPSEMSEHQSEIYKRTVKDPSLFNPESDKPEAFHTLEEQASIFVFPDGSVGKAGFEKYVITKKNSYMARPELEEYLVNLEYIKILSAKFGSIIEKVKNGVGESAWCYANFVETGAILLGLSFKGQGFELFSEKTSVFISTGSTVLPPVCSSENINENRRMRIKPKLRYGILTPQSSDAEANILLETFNSYENRHGDYIKVIIGSPYTRDGLNLANVQQIHIVGPSWNRATTYQAESRAIRSTSHVDLLEEERQKLILQGLNPLDARISIKVYYHASVTDIPTIDLVMYQKSEMKDIGIKRVMRMMKQASTDCQIHYRRNVRPGDIDGSAICDYDVCAYKCAEPTPRELGIPVDYTSYDVLYSKDIVDSAMEELKYIFKYKFSVTYNQLYNYLTDYRPEFIDVAATNLIVDKIPILNRYGEVSYIREDKGTLFLTKEFPLSTFEKNNEYSISDYTKNIIGVDRLSLSEYLKQLNMVNEELIKETLNDMDPESEEFLEELNKLSQENIIGLIEQAVINIFIQGIQTPTDIGILQKYESAILSMPEPSDAIKLSLDILKKRGTGRGRKPDPNTKFSLKPKQIETVLSLLDSNNDGDTVYIHSLYKDAEKANTSYSVAANVGKAGNKIRILKVSEGIWRDAEEYEVPVYQLIFSNQINQAKKDFDQFGIYGSVLQSDNEFRIHDKASESSEASKDKRKANRGRKCQTCHKGWLIDILHDFNIRTPNPSKRPLSVTRDDMIKFLRVKKAEKGPIKLDEFDEDKLKFFYEWYESGLPVKTICDILRNFMNQQGMLLIQ